MHGGRIQDFTQRTVGRREMLYDPLHENTNWVEDNDRSANWDYVLTILGSFGLFVLLATVGMLAWILGIV